MNVQPIPPDDSSTEEEGGPRPGAARVGSMGHRMGKDRTTPAVSKHDATAASSPPVPPVDRPPRGNLVSAQSETQDGEDAGTLATPQVGHHVQTGFQDMSRLLGAIKETLQSRDGQVQQTLQALPTFLQQVPRIHQAEIECLAQISTQLEHMGSGTRDVLARLDGLPDLLRTLALSQAEQQQFLEGLQSKMSEHLEVQGRAIREGQETSRKGAEAQLHMIRSIANTQEEVFSTFQNTQNRALNVFHRAQQNTMSQHRETQQVMNRQVEMLVDRVHSAQTRIFWLSIGFAALATVGLIAALIF